MMFWCHALQPTHWRACYSNRWLRVECFDSAQAFTHTLSRQHGGAEHSEVIQSALSVHQGGLMTFDGGLLACLKAFTI